MNTDLSAGHAIKFYVQPRGLRKRVIREFHLKKLIYSSTRYDAFN
jgi:hypothetical protein